MQTKRDSKVSRVDQNRGSDVGKPYTAIGKGEGWEYPERDQRMQIFSS
jgi:hypothetical protein